MLVPNQHDVGSAFGEPTACWFAFLLAFCNALERIAACQLDPILDYISVDIFITVDNFRITSGCFPGDFQMASGLIPDDIRMILDGFLMTFV